MYGTGQLAGLCDLTPLDYFLWGYVKAYVYADKLASIDALEDNRETFIGEIPAEMLERVRQNWTKRMDQLRRSRSQHLHEIIFKQFNYMDRTIYSNRFHVFLLLLLRLIFSLVVWPGARTLDLRLINQHAA